MKDYEIFVVEKSDLKLSEALTQAVTGQVGVPAAVKNIRLAAGEVVVIEKEGADHEKV